MIEIMPLLCISEKTSFSSTYKSLLMKSTQHPNIGRKWLTSAGSRKCFVEKTHCGVILNDNFCNAFRNYPKILKIPLGCASVTAAGMKLGPAGQEERGAEWISRIFCCRDGQTFTSSFITQAITPVAIAIKRNMFYQSFCFTQTSSQLMVVLYESHYRAKVHSHHFPSARRGVEAPSPAKKPVRSWDASGVINIRDNKPPALIHQRPLKDIKRATCTHATRNRVHS